MQVSFETLTALALLIHLAQVNYVLQALGKPCIGGQAVTSGAAGFLIISFYRFWQIKMGNEAHIGFIYTHAECNGGDDDYAVFGKKSLLV